MEPWHPAIQDAFDVLTGEKLTIEGYDLYEKEGLKDEENPLVPYNVTEPCIRKKCRIQTSKWKVVWLAAAWMY